MCQCTDDWMGYDCSIGVTVPPLVFTLDSGALCDLSLFPCDTFLIGGLNFVQTANLSCHLLPISVSLLNHKIFLFYDL